MWCLDEAFQKNVCIPGWCTLKHLGAAVMMPGLSTHMVWESLRYEYWQSLRLEENFFFFNPCKWNPVLGFYLHRLPGSFLFWAQSRSFSFLDLWEPLWEPHSFTHHSFPPFISSSSFWKCFQRHLRFCFFFNWSIFASHAVLVSAVEQSGSVIHIHTSPLF